MKKRIFAALLVAVMMVFVVAPVAASADSYTYNLQDKAVSSPEAYEWERTVRAEDLGIDAIVSITDICYRNDRIYIAMAEKIVITDKDFNTLQIIESYVKDGTEVAVSAPQCVFVTASGDIYFTEEAKGLIVQLDNKGDFVREIGDPHIKSIESITYAPTKVVVDDIGRIYVKAKSVYEGIIELDPDGNYNRFIGANKVSPSVFEIMKRKFATEEQIAKMALWLPTDYSDIVLDSEGYIFATVKSTKGTEFIKKLNLAGNNVLTTYEYIPLPAGDYLKGEGTRSILTNVATAEDGRFAVLDSSAARVFVYAPDGILLYILGGSGKNNGSFSSPVDLAFMGDRIMVADFVTCSIEVFKPTEYGELINTALYYQTRYDYDTAGEYWQKVYDINSNSIAANMGIGKSQLRSGQYEEALVSFERTGERKSWSEAFERVRVNWLEEHLLSLVIIFIVVIIAIEVLKRYIRKLSAKGVFENKKWVKVLRHVRFVAFKWPNFMMSSPFKAFDEVKYEGAGSTVFAFILMILYAWMQLINARYKGFLMNFQDIEHINVPLILMSSVAPFIIFVIANWAIGVLVDGKGNLRNIFVYTMYSLYPLIICSIIGVLLSRVCIYEEVGLVNIIYGIGWFFVVFYMFIGLVTVHQYSFAKGVANVLLTAVGMAIVIFIILLFATLLTGFVNDWGTIIDEIKIYI